jgi:hypothetical protein
VNTAGSANLVPQDRADLFPVDLWVPVAGSECWRCRQDFTLQDSGRSGTIVTFQAVDALCERPHPPVEVILVIDELNMQEGPQLQVAEDEAETFLRLNQGHLAQPVSIYSNYKRWTLDGVEYVVNQTGGELCSFGHKLECLKEHSIPASRRRN